MISSLVKSIQSRGRPIFFDKAMCLNTFQRIEVFYPTPPATADEALFICSLCDVQASCLSYALQNKEQGVWGGTEEEERQEALKAGVRTASEFYDWADLEAA